MLQALELDMFACVFQAAQKPMYGLLMLAIRQHSQLDQ